MREELRSLSQDTFGLGIMLLTFKGIIQKVETFEKTASTSACWLILPLDICLSTGKMPVVTLTGEKPKS